MTPNSEKYNASSSLVQPTTENETQPSTGNTLHKVLINSEVFTIRTDIRSAFLGGKNFGHGIHVFQNGNINIQTGPKKDGNGKLVTICRGGQIIKSGPIATERTGYRKSFLQEGEDDEIIAVEEYNVGNVVSETEGTHTIKGTNIVIDAADTLILKAPGGITIDTNGEFKIINANTVEENYSEKIENGLKLTHNVLERHMKADDPRSSDNIVISGHINRRIGGDYDMDVGGVSATRIMGNKALPGVPLVLNRSFGLHIGLTAPSAGFGGVNIDSKTGAMNLLAGVNMSLNAGALFDITTGGLTNIKSGGDISMSSAKGVGIASGGLAVPSGDVGDVKIRAAKDVKITATAGAIDMDATFIYLN